MMNGEMICGLPMMFGMGTVAVVLLGTLGLTVAAAIKYLRSGGVTGGRSPS